MKKLFLPILVFTFAFVGCQKEDLTSSKGNYAVDLTSGSNSRIKGSDEFFDLLGQTPIDIIEANTVKADGSNLLFHYRTFEGIVKYNTTSYVEDPNGDIIPAHDEYNLKVEVKGAVLSQPITFNKENYIIINKKNYYLLQYHFHYGSEHALNGKKADMEVHLVHQAEDGKLAVVGVFINKGKENKILHKIFEASPNVTGVTKSLLNFDATNLLPSDKSRYFSYSGSLTTPGGGVSTVPYLEGLKWFVFKSATSVGNRDYSSYTELYEEPNARSRQPTAGRIVLSYGR